MPTPLQAQRRALAAQQAACATRPALHAHRLAALAREQALAGNASSLAAYLQAGGAGLELTRAAWLDRCAQRLRLAAALHDAAGAQAALLAYQHALQPTAAAAWQPALVMAAHAAQRWQQRADAAAHQPVRLLHNLLAWQAGLSPAAEAGAAARSHWQAWAQADPVGARTVQRGVPLPSSQAALLPWDAAAWATWQPLLAAMPQPEHVTALPPLQDSLQAQQQAQARWLQALPGLAVPPTPLPQGCDAAVPGWQARAQMAPAAAAVAAQLDGLDARQRQWPSPLLQAHARRLRHALAGCRLDTEVEAVAQHAHACLGVHAGWQLLLAAAALAPLKAAVLQQLPGAGQPQAVPRATALAHALLGLGPRALLALPPVRQLLDDTLRAALDAPDDLGSLHGECGADLLQPLRALRAVAGRLPAPGHWASLLDRAGAPEPAAQPRHIMAWGQPHALHDWAALLQAPPQPPVPAWDIGSS